MKTETFSRLVLALALFAFVVKTPALEISIPDPGLNAAIREALNKPVGPFNERDFLSLSNLEARGRKIKSIAGLEAAHNLVSLDLESNALTSLSLPAEFVNLVTLDLSSNSITNLTVPSGLSNLAKLIIAHNLLPNFTLPTGLTGLEVLDLGTNQLTTLVLPPDLTQLTSLFLAGNPLATLVISDTTESTNLAVVVNSLRNHGVSVFTYPVTPQLLSPRRIGTGDFKFTLTGPPGVYTVIASSDLITWSELGSVTNQFGSVIFSDVTAGGRPQTFYRTRQ